MPAAGTSQAIGKRLSRHLNGTSVTPEFTPKRNSELSDNPAAAQGNQDQGELPDRGLRPQADLPRDPQRRPAMDPHPSLDQGATRVQDPVRRPAPRQRNLTATTRQPSTQGLELTTGQSPTHLPGHPLCTAPTSGGWCPRDPSVSLCCADSAAVESWLLVSHGRQVSTSEGARWESRGRRAGMGFVLASLDSGVRSSAVPLQHSADRACPAQSPGRLRAS